MGSTFKLPNGKSWNIKCLSENNTHFLDLPPTYDCTGQVDQCFVAVASFLEAHEKLSKPVKPGMG